MKIPKLQAAFWILSSILLLKVFVVILTGYRDYFPPSFSQGFLIGREDYFYGIYQFSFYVHIVVSPLALLNGTLLILHGIRIIKFSYSRHRALGKLQGLIVLLGVVPSGLIMAAPNFIGVAASSGLVSLAVLTAYTMVAAIRYAIKKDYVAHEIWATRCYLLLASPLLLRVINGTITTFELETDLVFAMTTWASWLLPLTVYELSKTEAIGTQQKLLRIHGAKS